MAINLFHSICRAEPLKKKKKLDPMIVRQREERRKKKIEKQIRRLEKNARQLKPIEEVSTPFNLIDEKELRTRNLQVSPETVEQRALLKKVWSRDRLRERLSDSQLLDRLMYAQQKALDELKLESEELYQAAVKIDTTFLPFTFKGPVDTPPIKDYESPDGEYLDISKKW